MIKDDPKFDGYRLEKSLICNDNLGNCNWDLWVDSFVK